jgi:DNA-binding Xre family transcriptional regulator
MAISYEPLWETMKEKGISTYAFKKKLGVGGGTFNRLKRNESITANTIDDLCRLIGCDISDIMIYTKETHRINKGDV